MSVGKRPRSICLRPCHSQGRQQQKSPLQNRIEALTQSPREASARASLLSRPARGLEWKSYGSALRLLRATPGNAAPFLVNHSRDCLEQSSRDPGLWAAAAGPHVQHERSGTGFQRISAAVAPQGESSDEATPTEATEAESDGRESFLLVTSGEFCEGTARSRATWRGGHMCIEIVGSARDARHAVDAEWDAHAASGTCMGDTGGTRRT
eukprot:s3796_g1.t1